MTKHKPNDTRYSFAALTAGLGMLVLQMLTRTKKGSLPSDVAAPCTSIWISLCFRPCSVIQNQ